MPAPFSPRAWPSEPTPPDGATRTGDRGRALPDERAGFPSAGALGGAVVLRRDDRGRRVLARIPCRVRDEAGIPSVGDAREAILPSRAEFHEVMPGNAPLAAANAAGVPRRAARRRARHNLQLCAGLPGAACCTIMACYPARNSDCGTMGVHTSMPNNLGGQLQSRTASSQHRSPCLVQRCSRTPRTSPPMPCIDELLMMHDHCPQNRGAHGDVQMTPRHPRPPPPARTSDRQLLWWTFRVAG